VSDGRLFQRFGQRVPIVWDARHRA
jgi:hypothetical protein